jgi:ARC6-like, IMS domain
MNKAFIGFALLVIQVLIAAALPSSAAQWIYIGKSTDELIYVDFDSIRGTGSLRTTWVKHVNTFNTLILKEEFNCRSREIRILRFVKYNSDGNVIATSDISFPADEVVPSSTGERTLNFICETLKLGELSQLNSHDETPQILKQEQALKLLNRWLKSKSQIFAPPFNLQLVRELTTGKLNQELNDPQGPIAWLKNNNSYYKYESQNIESILKFTAYMNRATIETKVNEKRTLYRHGKIDSQQSNSPAERIRYDLEYTDGKWKISDYTTIKP